MVQKSPQGWTGKGGQRKETGFRQQTGQNFFMWQFALQQTETHIRVHARVHACLRMFPPCLLMFPTCLPMCLACFSSAVSSHVPGVSSHVPAFFRTQKPYRSRFGSRESPFCIVNNSIFRYDPRIDPRIDPDSDSDPDPDLDPES